MGPWIVRRHADRWVADAVVRLPNGQAVLTDVDVASDGRAWAVGYSLPAGQSITSPLLLAWNGRSWEPVTLPWSDQASVLLHGVAAGPDGALLVSGARLARNNGRNRAFVARFQDGTWMPGLAPAPRYHNSELTDAGWARSRPKAVGATATRSMHLRGCLRPATPRPRPTDPSLSALAPSPAAIDVPTPTLAPSATSVDPSPAAVDEPTPATALSRSPSGVVIAPRITTETPLAPARAPAKRIRFRDVARRSGVFEVSETWGLISADFDGDGRADVFMGRHNRLRPRLLLGGRHGRFSRTPVAALRLRDRHGCATGDVDADGRPDLFCSIGANRGTNMTSNELWLAIGTRDRRQRTGHLGLNDPLGRGRTAVFFHLDHDPYPELFVGNEPQRSDALPSVDRLYLNDGGQRFIPAPDQGVEHSMGGICATAGDVDGDGDEDLLVCTTEAWAGLRRGLRVFRNDGGRLTHATQELGIVPIGDVDAVLADFDGDGVAHDLAQLGPAGLRVGIGGRAGQIVVHRRPIRYGVNLAAGDVNGDGRADLYVQRGGSRNHPDLLLLNRRAGRAWRSRAIPQVRSGLADDVVSLDHDQNGLADFLVTNGRMATGPVQLIASYRRSR
jgi:hypothetical protein